MGLRRRFQMEIAKKKHLRAILDARPIECTTAGVEVHMLLHHNRVLEGMWAYYSLARFLPGGAKLVVHDDGSLQDVDVTALKKLFPSCIVISRYEADLLVNKHFAKHGLVNCRKMRDSLVFGLKLFDVALLAKATHVLLLDSDVLTFAECEEIIHELEKPELLRNALYLEDICSRYCLDALEMRRRLGREHIIAFNPGIALVSAKQVDFLRLESHLSIASFWKPDSSANYFAELTLWAMELSLHDARPLQKSYIIAPTKPGVAGMVCCHYCGGITQTYLFYTDGIPKVREDLRQAGLLIKQD